MKPLKRIVVLSSAEYRLMIVGVLQFRNKLILQGRYTDAVDELLFKLQKARKTTIHLYLGLLTSNEVSNEVYT